MSFLRVLEGLVEESNASEGINPELLEMVDLDIMHSPVIAIYGESLEDAVEAIKTHGGKYIVRHPLIEGAVTADALKIMRLRYLLRLKEQQAKQFSHLFGG